MTFDDSDIILGGRILAQGLNACILGPAGAGKSRLALQLGIANQAGLSSFLCWEMRRTPGPWLYIQAENSNRRLYADLAKLREWVGPERWAAANSGVIIHTLETDTDGFLSLGNPENQKAIRELNGDLKPSVSVYDCLNNFADGDLNNDGEMLATLTMLSQLTKTGAPLRTPVILHHAHGGRTAAAGAVGFDRGRYGRNSKAMVGWTRGQINLAQGNESGDVLVVTCGKCSDGREFDPFAIRLNHASMIYEVETDFDLLAWRSEMGRGKPAPISGEEIVMLCADGGKTRSELVAAISAAIQCTERTAYRQVEKAEKRKFIRFDAATERYVHFGR